MKEKTIGIIIGMLLLVPVVAMNVSAEPTFDVKISGGFGVYVNITNTGNETEDGQGVWCKITDYKFLQDASGIPGIGGDGIRNLAPGKSQTYHWLVVSDWVHVFEKSPIRFKTPINFCTINVKVYENGGNNTIYSQESVNVLRILPFIIVLK